MLYDVEIREATLSILEERVLSVVDLSIMLISEGYVPNKNKTTKLQLSSILIDAFENIDVLSEEQHRKLENLYNKVISL
jgi:hypothetical protein